MKERERERGMDGGNEGDRVERERERGVKERESERSLSLLYCVSVSGTITVNTLSIFAKCRFDFSREINIFLIHLNLIKSLKIMTKSNGKYNL